MLAKLPIDDVLPALVAAVRERGVAVLVAPPGAGKTTRVPGALLDASLVDGEIVVLQPRRLAARMAAARVASERSVELGREVGYEVRFDRKVSASTRIRFVTEGVLTRRLLSDPQLRGVGCVIIDEFHERHLDGDLALALVSRLRTTRPELKLVVMSATLDAEPVAAFLDNAPIVRSEGRTFPVTIEFEEQPDDRQLGKRVASAVRRIAQGDSSSGTASKLDGDVLVFLPGSGEIRRVAEDLSDAAAVHDLEVLPLHGDLTADEQDRAVRRSKRRKVILATNVAETSITIDGVVAVIDSGLARIARHSPWTGLASLQVEPVSRASCTQRAGRAGRTRPGRVIRLYTKHDHDLRRAFEVPEIQRADLAGVALELYGADISGVSGIRWYEAPPEIAVKQADELLLRLGAIENAPTSSTSTSAKSNAPASSTWTSAKSNPPASSTSTSAKSNVPASNASASNASAPNAPASNAPASNAPASNAPASNAPASSTSISGKANAPASITSTSANAPASGTSTSAKSNAPASAPAPSTATSTALDASGAPSSSIPLRSITRIGRRMLRFPIHPRLARLIFEAEERGAPREACTIAAAVGARELRLERRGPAGQARVSSSSDLLDDLDAMERARGDGMRADRLRREGLDIATAHQVAKTADQLVKNVEYRAHGMSTDEIDEQLLISILAAFPDRVGKRRAPRSSEIVFAGGGSGTLSPSSSVIDADLMVAVDIAEVGAKGAQTKVQIRRASAIQASWLLDLFLDRIEEKDELVWDAKKERVERVVQMTYDGLAFDEQRDVDGARKAGRPAAELLARQAIAAGIDKFVDKDELAQWRARVTLAAKLSGKADLAAPDDEGLARVIANACAGAISFAELRNANLMSLLDAGLGEHRALVQRLAPTHLQLTHRRRAAIHYSLDQPPWIASRMQDFFGLPRAPSVGDGKVPLVVHLLAPNQRPVQVTSDLPGFWVKHYPALRKQLMRRYPKHQWPEDPRQLIKDDE